MDGEIEEVDLCLRSLAKVPGKRIVPDCWTHILSFLNVREVGRVGCTCLDVQPCLARSPIVVTINHSRNIFPPREWWIQAAVSITKYSKLRRLSVLASNCPDGFLTTILNWLQKSNHTIDFSVTKCFSLSENTISILPYCRHACIGDVLYSSQRLLVEGQQLASLKTLVLSNSTFSATGEFAWLWGNLPKSLKLLALGGSRRLLQSAGMVTFPVQSGYSQLVIECTYLSPEDIGFIAATFPDSMRMDLCSENIGYLNSCVARIDAETTDNAARFPYMTELLSCASPGIRQTPLHRACVTSNENSCQWLLQQGAMVEAKDARGATPLHRAVETRQQAQFSHAMNCVQLLLNAGASLYIKNQANETPLYLACINGNDAALKAMLNSIEDDNGMLPFNIRSLVDHQKYTLLHGAVLGRNTTCCSMLLDWSAYSEKRPIVSDLQREAVAKDNAEFVNRPNCYGVTAVHLAHRYAATGPTGEDNGNENHIGLVNLLVTFGANLALIDNDGNSMSDYLNSRTASKKIRRKKLA